MIRCLRIRKGLICQPMGLGYGYTQWSQAHVCMNPKMKPLSSLSSFFWPSAEDHSIFHDTNPPFFSKCVFTFQTVLEMWTPRWYPDSGVPQKHCKREHVFPTGLITNGSTGPFSTSPEELKEVIEELCTVGKPTTFLLSLFLSLLQSESQLTVNQIAIYQPSAERVTVIEIRSDISSDVHSAGESTFKGHHTMY